MKTETQTVGTGQHTAGPWTWDGLGNISASGGAKIIAKVAKELDGFRVGLARSEKDANARLIAAAPDTAAERDRLKASNAELLLALQQIADDKIAGSYRSASRLQDIARAALAGAQGGGK